MEQIVRVVERVAGFFLALIALLIFLSVLLRFFFSANLPDAFDFSGYLQAIAIFWGLAVTTYRGGHIGVDLLWEVASERGKWLIDLFARIVTTAAFAFLAWRLFARLPSMIDSNQVTNELAVRIWPFYLAAVLGTAACVLVSTIALVQMFTKPAAGQGHG